MNWFCEGFRLMAIGFLEEAPDFPIEEFIRIMCITHLVLWCRFITCLLSFRDARIV